MMHFQQTMLQMTQHFLSTQQEVMLCYLQEVSRSQGATTPHQVNSRQLLHLVETPVEPKQPDVSIEEQAKASDYHQQSLVDDRVGMLSASENFVMPSRTESGIAVDEVTPDLSNEGLIAALMELISERTGYPLDMIDPNLDLESDLGIDSIKRIEILNKFQSVLPSERRALLENSLEELTSARTVNQIIEWIIKPRDAID
jgi:acyl carrier protein